jgi:prepilin-type N-terminal cleavage/methylation domain-containing protein
MMHTRSIRRRLREHAEDQRGYTLIEVLATTMMVAAVSAAMAVGLISISFHSGDQRRRSQAAQIAQQDQERLRGFSAEQLNNLNQSRTVTLDGTPFTVTSTAAFVSSTGASSCTSGSAAFYRIVSSVNWASNARTPVVGESLATPPAGGTLLVQTIDQTSAPLSGVGVTASGPDYDTGITGATGCTVLSDMTPGNYAVTATETGYVDSNGNSSPPGLSATITGTGVSLTSVHPIQLGLAGNISANFTTQATGSTVSCPPSTGTCTGQQSDALSWFGNGSSASMSGYASSTLASPGTLIPAAGTIPLFPFWFTSTSYASNYQVWAGKCQQNQPPTGVNKVSVNPGSTQTGLAVQEPALNVIVQNNTAARNNTPVWTRVKPAHVKLSFSNSSGNACSDSWQAPIASDADKDTNGSLANPGQPFATTATTGATASASGLTGTYAVCADYNGHQSTVNNVQNNNFSATTPVTVQINQYTSSPGTC